MQLRTLSISSLLMTASLLASAQSTNPPVPVGFVRASNAECSVGKPNIQPTDSVTWSGKCRGPFAHGIGVAQWSSAGRLTFRYEGDFINGLLNGIGSMRTADGDTYYGEFLGGLHAGQGTLLRSDGTRQQGIFANNRLVTSSDGRAEAKPAPPAHATAQQSLTPEASKSALDLVLTDTPTFEGAGCGHNWVRCKDVKIVAGQMVATTPADRANGVLAKAKIQTQYIIQFQQGVNAGPKWHDECRQLCIARAGNGVWSVVRRDTLCHGRLSDFNC